MVVYYAFFERGILESLADFFPEHGNRIRSIQNRLWDQYLIFKDHYKHPTFGGTNSIKSVLPTLVPSLRYDLLDVQDGREAQAVWDLILDSNSDKDRKRMIGDLKAYCELDTKAMVEIHKVLLREIN